MNKANKIKQFFSKSLTKDVQSVMLLEVSDGSYLAFGRYSIKPKNECYEIKIVNEPWRDRPLISDRKIAIAWCIYDKHCMIKETKRLQDIDTELSGIKIKLAVLQQKLNKAVVVQDKHIYLAKIQEIKYKRSKLLRELNQHIGITSLWQKEKFEKIHPTYS